VERGGERVMGRIPSFFIETKKEREERSFRLVNEIL